MSTSERKWWKLDELSPQEFNRWVSEVARAEKRAKRDKHVIRRSAFVIYEMDGCVDYIAGDVEPPGAYRIECWRLAGRGWKMEYGR